MTFSGKFLRWSFFLEKLQTTALQCFLQKNLAVIISREFYTYLPKRGTIQNDLKQPEKTYNEQKATWHNLKRAKNDLQRPETTTSKKRIISLICALFKI